MNRRDVESFIADGCGRCDFYKTPQCKVSSWREPLRELRKVLQESGLNEEMKWGAPCYTLDGKNVAMLVALRDFCGISFFKGALLDDPDGRLRRPGPNTQAARYITFKGLGQVRAERAIAVDFVRQAVEAERAGRTVEYKQTVEAVPAELQDMLDGQPDVAAAFEALTRGRRRSYVLHVGGAKQAKTRAARAERCVAKILAGKGFNER